MIYVTKVLKAPYCWFWWFSFSENATLFRCFSFMYGFQFQLFHLQPVTGQNLLMVWKWIQPLTYAFNTWSTQTWRHVSWHVKTSLNASLLTIIKMLKRSVNFLKTWEISLMPWYLLERLQTILMWIVPQVSRTSSPYFDKTGPNCEKSGAGLPFLVLLNGFKVRWQANLRKRSFMYCL